MAEIDPIVLAAAIIYFAAVFIIGAYSRKFMKSPTDYAVAGRSVGSFVNGAALASTYFSPASFLGLPGFIFVLGGAWAGALIAIAMGGTLALVTAIPLRKYAPVSFTDYYADRYESQKLMRILAGIPTVYGGTLYIILSVFGAALFLVALLKIPYPAAVVLAVAVIMFYLWVGGMVATSWNAAMQCIVMTVAAVAAAVGIVAYFGGLPQLTQATLSLSPVWFNYPPQPTMHKFVGWWFAVWGWFWVWHFGQAGMPYSVVRFFTAMDMKSARRSIIWYTAWGCILYLTLTIIGMGANALITQNHPLMPVVIEKLPAKFHNALGVMILTQKTYGLGSVFDYSLIAAVEALRNPALLGLLVAGGLAIAMATAAGWAMVLNVLISRDWMGIVAGIKRAKEKPILWARIWTTIFLLIALIWLLFLPPKLTVVATDLSGGAFVAILASLFPSLILGLYWKRATKMAAVLTSIIMFTLAVVMWLWGYFIGSPHLWPLDPTYAIPHQFYVILLSFPVFIIISLLTKPCKEETIKKYCEDLHKL